MTLGKSLSFSVSGLPLAKWGWQGLFCSACPAELHTLWAALAFLGTAEWGFRLCSGLSGCCCHSQLQGTHAQVEHCFTNVEYCLRSQEDTAPRDCCPLVGLGGLQGRLSGQGTGAVSPLVLQKEALLPYLSTALLFAEFSEPLSSLQKQKHQLIPFGFLHSNEWLRLPGAGFSISLGGLL